jgi:hypothetical protein
MVNRLECCQTWVSDKSLVRLAQALQIDAFQLLMPPESMAVSKDYLRGERVLKLREAVQREIQSLFADFMQGDMQPS